MLQSVGCLDVTEFDAECSFGRNMLYSLSGHSVQPVGTQCKACRDILHRLIGLRGECQAVELPKNSVVLSGVIPLEASDLDGASPSPPHQAGVELLQVCACVKDSWSCILI